MVWDLANLSYRLSSCPLAPLLPLSVLRILWTHAPLTSRRLLCVSRCWRKMRRGKKRKKKTEGKG